MILSAEVPIMDVNPLLMSNNALLLLQSQQKDQWHLLLQLVQVRIVKAKTSAVAAVAVAAAETHMNKSHVAQRCVDHRRMSQI
jgi:hypothetical protein